MDMLNIKVNGLPIEAPKGSTVLEATRIAYDLLKSVNATAKAVGVSTKTVLKTLCTSGVYPTEQAELVNRLIVNHTQEEIANRLSIKVKTVQSYLPYTKGTYLTSVKTVNAQRIAACRKRKKGRE